MGKHRLSNPVGTFICRLLAGLEFLVGKVVVTDLLCAIVLCCEFVSIFGSQAGFLVLLLMISCVRIWFPVPLDWRW